jgi:outer membrane protein assembly factor BamB
VFVNDISAAKVYAYSIHSGDQVWATALEHKMANYDQMTLSGNYLVTFSTGNDISRSTVYTIDKSSGQIINRFESRPAVDAKNVDDKGIYVVTYAKVYSKELLSDKILWQTEKPYKKFLDSTVFNRCRGRLTWSVTTDNEILTYEDLICDAPLPTCAYNRITFFDKVTGKVNRVINCENLDNCSPLGVDVTYILNEKVYYPNMTY